MMNMFNKKNDEIKITKEEFRKKALEVLTEPFGVEENNSKDEKEFDFAIKLAGTFIISKLESKLFEKDE